MRDRRPSDWATDLGGRHRLEDEMARALAGHPELVMARRATNSLDHLDFQVLGPGQRLAHVELKAKHQPYRGWAGLRPELRESDVFLLDELALRKIVEAGRYACMVVADLPSSRWCVWSTVELVLASKVRAVRTLSTGMTRVKGKVLLDLREAAVAVDSADAAAGAVAESISRCDRLWGDIAPWPGGPVVYDPTRRTS